MNERDKREFVEDGLSPKRKEHFEAASLKIRPSLMSLDEYIHFLDDLQRVFPPLPVSREKTVTKFNKL
jgi:hypothetical protein